MVQVNFALSFAPTRWSQWVGQSPQCACCGLGLKSLPGPSLRTQGWRDPFRVDSLITGLNYKIRLGTAVAIELCTQLEVLFEFSSQGISFPGGSDGPPMRE